MWVPCNAWIAAWLSREINAVLAEGCFSRRVNNGGTPSDHKVINGLSDER